MVGFKIILLVGHSLRTKIAVSDFLNNYPTLLLYDFSPNNGLVKSQSKSIRILFDKVVEEMNPRCHVRAYWLHSADDDRQEQRNYRSARAQTNFSISLAFIGDFCTA